MAVRFPGFIANKRNDSIGRVLADHLNASLRMSDEVLVEQPPKPGAPTVGWQILAKIAGQAAGSS